MLKITATCPVTPGANCETNEAGQFGSAAGAALLTIRYAQLHQMLVEHDVDRFLSIELLARVDGRITVIMPRADPDMSTLVKIRNERVKTLGPVSRLLSKLYLRYQDSGVVYALRFLTGWREAEPPT